VERGKKIGRICVARYCQTQPHLVSTMLPARFTRFWCKLSRGHNGPPSGAVLRRRQHHIPDGGRTSIFEAQLAVVELTLVDPAQQFNAGNHGRRGREPLEPEHRTDAQLYAAVVLLDQVVQVFRGGWQSSSRARRGAMPHTRPM
jgi:hypothetical protein